MIIAVIVQVKPFFNVAVLKNDEKHGFVYSVKAFRFPDATEEHAFRKFRLLPCAGQGHYNEL